MSSGKLELTWANKDRRLLAHDDVTYEWVDRSDWRVAEVRLLDEVASYGTEPEDNLLVQGDALHALEALTCIPEYADRYLGRVRQVVIDPPFNTGQSFRQYDDNLEHSVWLTMLRDRLEQIRRLLADDGSVWVHLDDAEQHRARCVLDEVFGPESFVATVVWQKRRSRESRAAFSVSQDYIHVYSKSSDWRDRRNRLPGDQKGYANPDDDPRGPWKAMPMTAQGFRENQMYEITTPSGRVLTPPRGRCWAYIRPSFDRLVADNRIYWGKDGSGGPSRKRFRSEDDGLVPLTLWTSAEVGDNAEAKRQILSDFDGEAFATPKPERLLERIIHIGSDPGDIVLDCFAGSGTTAAVAHKMGRRWVAVELSGDTVDTFVRPRLKKVVDGADPGGVTDMVGWQGGGGFSEVKVAPSMFEQVDGNVVLSDWAVNGQLAAAVAAQLKFAREPDGPFVGRRGRTRLAVLDGMLTAGLAEHLVGHLGEQETLVVVAMALQAGVAEHVRTLRPGSRARKVPRDLARSATVPPRLARLDSVSGRRAGR